MKQLFLIFLLAVSAIAQTTPAQYPYPDPLPTTGATPGSTIKITSVLNPTAYNDNRPVVWDDFVGGGFRACASTAERDSIMAGRRKEGMLVWVKADGHTYQLQSNLTSWTDLGVLAAGGSATTIYNGNGSLSSSRTLTGAGFNLDLAGLGIFTTTAGTAITLAAPTVTLNGGSFTRINNSGPYPFLFAAAPSVATSTHELLARNPATGEVTFTPSATIGGASGVYRGVTSGTPGAWVAATATLTPSYSSGSQPPEATVAILKFPSASVGGDTLQFGDNTTGIAIRRKDNTAIQSDDITAGQYIVFTRSGTSSGSHWTCESCGDATAPSPDSNSMVSIDTTADLINSTANVAVTRGYRSIGDGGHAAYRLDTGSAAATNTVTVFEASTGRYFLMSSGSISALQSGSYGDGSTDDRPFLQAGLTASAGQCFRIDPLTYRVAGSLTIPDHTKVIARGATVTCQTTGSPGVSGGSWTVIDGGEWKSDRQSGGANGYDNSCLAFGNYVSSGSVSNFVVRNVKVSVIGYVASGIFITGGSHNFLVENVEVPSSATMDDGVVVHWGYVSGSEVNGTLHPHDGVIRNVNCGEFTTSTADGSPVFVSGSYNILVENAHSLKARHGVIAVVGDFGFKYSGFAAQTMASVTYRNVSCLNAVNIGALVQGVGLSSVVYPQEFVFENCTLLGPNDGSNNGGAYLNQARNVTFRNCMFAGHSQGTTFVDGSKNITFDRCTFTTNYLAGILVDDATTIDVSILGCNVYNNARSLSGTNAAGIKLKAGSQARVIGCHLGNTTTEPNQEVGIGVSAAFVNATIAGNFVHHVKGGGINYAYHLGSSADAPTHLWLVYDNQAASGITLMSAPEVLPYSSRGTKRTFTGTGAPTFGTFLVGERVTLDAATSTPFEKVCTVAGSPGTWANSY